MAFPDTVLASASRSVLRWVRRWFRYRRFRLALVPEHEIEVHDGVYRALGNDPQFRLTAGRSRLPCGWCRLRYEARALTGHLQPKLYVDAGGGFTESSSLKLPFATGRTQNALVRLSDPVALRLDPCEYPTEFALVGIDVTEYGRIALGIYALVRLSSQLFSPPGRAMRRIRHGWKVLREGGIEALRERVIFALTHRPDYDEWLATFDTPAAAELNAYRERAKRLPRRPLVSIVLPVYNTPERLLRECIESVRAQTYSHWELCIADDASTAAHVSAVLAEYAAADARVRVVTRERNGHISAASNSALALATGEFVAFLDHDDLLAPHALSCMVERHGAGEFDLAYSDEDHIDATGRRYDPFFKPDWNEDLFLSVNYVCHLTMVRRDLVTRAGGFREGYEGAQDFDLLLRVSRGLDRRRIAHVPRILYHWRAIAGSTARSTDEKAYAGAAGLAALRDHLAAIGGRGEAEPGPLPTTYRVRWRLPDPPPRASIIIPTRDRVDLLRRCIESIVERTDYPVFEILVVDNDSERPETLAYLRQIEREGRARVLRFAGPFNFSAINNVAMRAAAGSIVAFVNNDIEVIDGGWLTELVSHAARPDVGAVGPKLLYADGNIQHAGLILGIGGVAGHAFRHFPGTHPGTNGRAALAQSVSAVTAACLVIRKSVCEEVGGFDAERLKVAFNDVDLCIKVREAGYRNVYTPYARLKHHESASRGSDQSPEKAARFKAEVDTMLQRWGQLLEQDPAYNPNLTLSGEDFSLAWPPRLPG
jgi:GT2 family glycosyltransferase